MIQNYLQDIIELNLNMQNELVKKTDNKIVKFNNYTFLYQHKI